MIKARYCMCRALRCFADLKNLTKFETVVNICTTLKIFIKPKLFMKDLIFVLFGAPGSGKGYLGECIRQAFLNGNIVHENEIAYISTGDLLRQETASGSELGQEIAETMNSGGLVSDDIVDRLVADALERNHKIKFLDGYPRTLRQMGALVDMLGKRERPYTLFAVWRKAFPAVIEERVSKRRVCKDCKTTHSADDGKCPKCGGVSLIRDDDARIEQRLETYARETMPVWSVLESLAKVKYVVMEDEPVEEAVKIIFNSYVRSTFF